jgi:hypothetical protein
VTSDLCCVNDGCRWRKVCVLNWREGVRSKSFVPKIVVNEGQSSCVCVSFVREQ